MSLSTFDTLQSRFDSRAAEGMNEVFQFHFSDAADHYLLVKNGTLRVEQGEHADPSVSLNMSTETLKGVMSGEISGMSAFMTGKLKATGDVMLATKLSSLFPNG